MIHLHCLPTKKEATHFRTLTHSFSKEYQGVLGFYKLGHKQKQDLKQTYIDIHFFRQKKLLNDWVNQRSLAFR